MAEELLQISPLELRFRFELRKQIPSSLRLSNPTNGHVAFKVKTTAPKKYCVRPNTGTVAPHTTTEVTVIMQQQKEQPANPTQVKDKFLVQSVALSEEPKEGVDFGELFSKEKAPGPINETKLKVSYVMPNQPPSPVPEEREMDADEAVPSPAAPMTTPAAGDTKYENAMASLAQATNESNQANAEATRLRKDLADMLQQVQKLESNTAKIATPAAASTATKPAGKSKMARIVTGFTIIHLLLTAILAFLLGRYT